MSGGGIMNTLGSILDPLGLFSQLQQMVSGTDAAGNGQPAATSKLSSTLLDFAGQGKDVLASHSSDAPMPVQVGGAESAAKTELLPRQTATPVTGYSEGDGPAQSDTLAPTPQAQTQTFADTAATLSEADAEMMRHLMTVDGNFSDFDDQGARIHNGNFDRDNLRRVKDDPAFSADERAAAAYLLEHPDLYNQLAIMSGGNGYITDDVLSAYVQKRLEALQGPNSSPELTGVTTTNSSAQSAGTGEPPAPQVAPAPSPATPAYTPTGPATYESVCGRMGSLQSELLVQLNKSLDPDPNVAAAAKAKVSDLQMQLQTAVEMYQTMKESYSNIMKACHDVNMNTINNTR